MRLLREKKLIDNDNKY